MTSYYSSQPSDEKDWLYWDIYPNCQNGDCMHYAEC